MNDTPELAAIRVRDAAVVAPTWHSAQDDRRTPLGMLDEARALSIAQHFAQYKQERDEVKARFKALEAERDALAAKLAASQLEIRQSKAFHHAYTEPLIARVAALERIVSRHVKWRDKALRYLCMVRDRAPSYRPLIERFIDDSTASMIGSVDEEISRAVAASQSETDCDPIAAVTRPHKHIGSPTMDRGETCLTCGQDMHAPIHSQSEPDGGQK